MMDVVKRCGRFALLSGIASSIFLPGCERKEQTASREMRAEAAPTLSVDQPGEFAGDFGKLVTGNPRLALEKYREALASGKYSKAQLEGMLSALLHPRVPLEVRLETFADLPAATKANCTFLVMEEVLKARGVSGAKEFYSSLPPGRCRKEAIGSLMDSILKQDGIDAAVGFTGTLDYRDEKIKGTGRLVAVMDKSGIRNIPALNDFLARVEDPDVRNEFLFGLLHRSGVEVTAEDIIGNYQAMSRGMKEERSQKLWSDLCEKPGLKTDDYLRLLSTMELTVNERRIAIGNSARVLVSEAPEQLGLTLSQLEDMGERQLLMAGTATAICDQPEKGVAFGNSLESPEDRTAFFSEAATRLAMKNASIGENPFLGQLPEGKAKDDLKRKIGRMIAELGR